MSDSPYGAGDLVRDRSRGRDGVVHRVDSLTGAYILRERTGKPSRWPAAPVYMHLIARRGEWEEGQS